MIRLRWSTLQRSHNTVLGPAPFFRVDGLVLRQGPHNQIVGRYRDRMWMIDGTSASSCECTERTCIYFEDSRGTASQKFGPFSRVHFPNGSCYADKKPFAVLDEDFGSWLCCANGIRWPTILIAPADVPTADGESTCES
jgi:hypothetical protein